MKTDRFDEEFRRKLLGLPADTDSGEVERVHEYVRTNKPALPGPGWGKLLLYGGGSLLLIGSLSYNLIQNYRNTRLQSSIDSLAHQSVGHTTSSGEIIRHDTVYITRSANSKGAGTESVSKPEIAEKELLEPENTTQLDGTRPGESIAMGRRKLPQSGNESNPALPETTSSLALPKTNNSGRTDVSVAPNRPNEKSGQAPDGQTYNKIGNVVESLPDASPERSVTGKTRLVKESNSVKKSMPDENATATTGYPNNRIVAATRSGNRRHTKSSTPTISSEIRPGSLVTNYADKQNQRTVSAPSTSGMTLANTETSTLNEAASERSGQTIAVQPLTSHLAITASKQGSVIVPSRPLVVARNVAPAQPTRRPWHLTMPSLAVPNAQYRVGVGLTAGGGNQFGGTLLGEIMLNPRWSVQAGLRVAYGEGFHYRDEQDFDEHQKENFRQMYAPHVSSSSDIEDITQMNLLIQVPLQVAYHLPLGRQWGLRLGVGTDLDVWARSAISYDYQENSRSSQHGLSRIKESVYVFNNLTLSPSIERSWKKWLFRAGPFVNPQLRPVGYKPEDLSWGANLQVLYRLGK